MAKTESKWMKELARQNYIYFTEKLQALEVKRKVQVMREIRERLADRLMKVYRMFRHKKYGESLEAPKRESKDDIERANAELREIKKQALEMKKKIERSRSNNVELITVIEEESMVENELDETLPLVTKNPGEHIMEYTIENAIYEWILIHADNVVRVKNFL